ncbi:MAG: DUF4349 domain-containing protein [Clostridia bacterium]|nr:DUF4349 domain-containing protein [Clostridia bacterium]
MDCVEARELFSPYLDGVLAEEDQSALEQHLNHCLLCRQEFKDWAEMLELLRSLPPVSPPPDFPSTLHRKLIHAAKEPFWRRPITQGSRRALALALASCLLIGALVGPAVGARHHALGLLASLGDRIGDLAGSLDGLSRNHNLVGWKWFPGMGFSGGDEQPGNGAGGSPEASNQPRPGGREGSGETSNPEVLPEVKPGALDNSKAPQSPDSPNGPVHQLPLIPAPESSPEVNPPVSPVPDRGIIVGMPEPKPVGVTVPEHKIALQLAFALEVDDYDQGLAALRSEVSQKGGNMRISEGKRGELKTAVVAISIPFPQWDQLVVSASRLGAISDTKMQRTDLSGAFTQTYERLKELRREEAILIGKERQAKDLSAQAEIQDQLLQVRDQLSSQYRYFNFLCSQVNNVRMEIYLSGPTAPQADQKTS